MNGVEPVWFAPPSPRCAVDTVHLRFYTFVSQNYCEPLMYPTSASQQEQLCQLMGRLVISVRPTLPVESVLTELTLPQLRIVLLLFAQGPLRMSALAAQLETRMSATAWLVGKLEQRGLVRRTHDSVDRRVVHCALTDQGKAEVELFWRFRKERLAEITSSFTAEEMDIVLRAMEIWVRAAESSMLGPADQPEAA